MNYKFNLIFIDPPFKDKNLKLLLNNLNDMKILNSKTLIIIHRHKSSLDNLDEKFKIVREEVYGSSKIIFGYINS